jgi:hypothetical protein
MNYSDDVVRIDKDGEEYILDENGNKIPPKQTNKKKTSSGFTTYDSKNHCSFCGNLYCRGECFK